MDRSVDGSLKSVKTKHERYAETIIERDAVRSKLLRIGQEQFLAVLWALGRVVPVECFREYIALCFKKD